MVLSKVSLIDDIVSSKISSGQVAIWWIGQAGYFIKTSNGKVIVVDAYLSGGSSRMIPSPLEPEQIECDLYICTHNHNDHTDLISIPRISKKHAMTFVGPRNVVKSLLELGINRDCLREVNAGDLVELAGIKIRGTFCIPTDDTVLDSIGLMIQTEDGITLYHSGDTGFHDFLFYLSKFTIDVMMVCINGGMGNMDIDDAVKLTRYLHTGVVIPNHYGMFVGNTADPVLFRTRLMSTGAEPLCKILRIGEKYVYSRSKR